jgi:hypothetical protein
VRKGRTRAVCGELAHMRNRALHDALREFALEAAALLCDEQRSGAELEFDVIEEKRRGGPALYRYEPLTDTYLSQRWDRLRMLPTCPAAASALGAGAEQYLRVNGVSGGGDEAESALRAMLERLYEDATSFAFPEERFETVYAEVERMLYLDATHTAVVAPLLGVELEPERVEFGEGLALVRAAGFDGPAAIHDEAAALCVLERDTAPGDPPLADEASARFGQLERGLRLYKPGAVRLGALAWIRPGGGRWQPVDLGYSSGAVRGDPWILVAGEEPELLEFLGAVSRPLRAGPVAWALARFEMGCAREQDPEALSDHLLALRALLDAGTEAGEASLSLRLAALCAEEPERRIVQRRVELALALERFVIAGGRGDDYVDRVGSESPRMLVSEIERHLRALLRDVLCGYLDPDLKSLADDILLKNSELETPTPADTPTEELEALEAAVLSVRRLTPDRAEVEELAEVEEFAEVEEPPLPEAEPPLEEPDPEPIDEPEPVEEPEPVDEPPPPEPVGALDGVTPSSDWDDYSAPV